MESLLVFVQLVKPNLDREHSLHCNGWPNHVVSQKEFAEQEKIGLDKSKNTI